MAQASIYDQILDPASRANPYPLYAELRKTPVARQDDGTYRRQHVPRDRRATA